MGTNYYLLSRHKKMVHKYFPYEYEYAEEPYLAYEIHLCKVSFGWKVLWEEHRNAYNSVEELIEFIRKYNKWFKIYDEYSRLIPLDQFIDDVVHRNERHERKLVDYEGVGKIWTPIDHVEIAERDTRSGYWIKYYHDKDGHDFTDSHFFA